MAWWILAVVPYVGGTCALPLCLSACSEGSKLCTTEHLGALDALSEVLVGLTQGERGLGAEGTNGYSPNLCAGLCASKCDIAPD